MIDKIRERLAAATPGPWECGYTSHGTYPAIFAKGKQEPVAQKVDGMKSFNGNETAEFIANAPTDIAFLLFEVDRLTAENAQISAERDAGRRTVCENYISDDTCTAENCTYQTDCGGCSKWRGAKPHMNNH